MCALQDVPRGLSPLSVVSLEYLAGFIDGEGHLEVSRRRRKGRSLEYNVRLSISNTNRPILEEIRATWGGSLWSGTSRNPRWKPAHDLIWTNAAAARLVATVAPHLRIRAEQVAALLLFLRHLRNYHRARDAAGRLLPLTERDLMAREAFYRRLKLLNRRGPMSPRGLVHFLKLVRPGGSREVSVVYAAGLFDAEGSLMISKIRNSKYGGHKYKARASISNTDRYALEDVQRMYGGVLYDQPSRKAAWKDSYQLIWTEARVDCLLEAIGPHLRVKRMHVRLLREFMRHKRNTSPFRESLHGMPLPGGVHARMESLYRQVKGLNAKGPAC